MANSYREYLKMKKYGGEGGDTPSPTLISKTINANGLYLPEDDQADGYNSVSVNVPEVSDIAFVPPQKFKSNGSNLEDYKIFGSDDVVTETETSVLPLTFTTTEDKLRDWEIRGNDDVGENLVNPADDINSANISNDGSIVFNADYKMSLFKIEQGVTYTICPENATSVGYIYGIFVNKPTIGSQAYDQTRSIGVKTFVAPITGWCAFRGELNSTESMAVKGSTAPDHYIPYQQGVGERTVNLLPYVNGTYTHNRMTVTCNNGRYVIDIAEGTGGSVYTIPLPEFKIPVCQAQGGNGVLLWLNSTASYTMNVTLKKGSSAITSNLAIAPVNRVITNYSNDTSEVLCDGLQIYCGNISGTVHMELSPMLINTAQVPTTFIPYGYQIPFTVSQAGQTDKNYDIYIGDSPLTEGETVSKTSTGQDIELFKGENTISTTLYNKPETSVTYAASGGVGEEVSGSYVIPVKINSTTTNVPIGDTPLMEDEYVSYAEQKIYRYVEGTLTPVDPPSALPQIATANGVNELSVETDVQPELVQIGLGIPVELIPTALGTKTITANDTYDASDDSLDGYSSVTVNVQPNVGTKSITANDTYNASDDSLDGYSSVTVNVPEKVLTTKTITASGTYNAVDDQADGYSSVTVNVSSYNETWVNKIDFVITEVTS